MKEEKGKNGYTRYEYKRRTQLQLHQTSLHLSHRALFEAKKETEREKERVPPPLLSARLPPSLRLAEFLSFLATFRRLITPSPSTEIFLYVYGSCICKISMSLHLLTPPVLFHRCSFSPHYLRPFLCVRSLILCQTEYTRRKNRPFVFTVILLSEELQPAYQICIINKAF